MYSPRQSETYNKKVYNLRQNVAIVIKLKLSENVIHFFLNQQKIGLFLCIRYTHYTYMICDRIGAFLRC